MALLLAATTTHEGRLSDIGISSRLIIA